MPDIGGTKHDLAGDMQDLPDDAFKGKPNQQKIVFATMFMAFDDIITEEEWEGIVTSIRSTIRSKADGLVDGKTNDDRIKSREAQEHICMKTNDLVASPLSWCRLSLFFYCIKDL